MADEKISQLTTVTSLTGAELIPLVQSGSTVNASAATIANQLPASGVAAGSYTNANITVNAKGQITTAANGSAGGGGGITALTGDVTASGTGSVAATLATVNGNVGSYTNASITVNAKGQITAASSGTSVPASVALGAAGIVINGGGSTIVSGIVGDVVMPYSGTITGVELLADQAGSIVVDIWRASYANYPPTIANTITASDLPTLSSALKSSDSTLTGWTKSVNAGDVLRFNVNSATTVTRVTLILTITKS